MNSRSRRSGTTTRRCEGPFQGSAGFAPLDTTLSAMQAVSRTKNCVQRLRHLTAVSRHRTLQSAATELGMARHTLNYQLKRIEETAGFTIISIGRSQPLTVTEDGRKFLNEAMHLLSLLETTEPFSVRSRDGS